MQHRSLRWRQRQRLRTCRIAGTEGAELRFRPSRGTPPLLIVSDFNDWHRYFTHCVTVTGGGKLSRLIRRIIAANKNRGTANSAIWKIT